MERSNNILIKIFAYIFGLLALWWVTIAFRGLQEGFENNAFTLAYPFLALIGGLGGLISARKWGGLKSKLGQSLYFLSLGLLSQFFGQASYAYYIYILGIEVPYPSLGDVGYFGSIIFYIAAIMCLGKVVAAVPDKNVIKKNLIILSVPLVGLMVSYMIFLQGYTFDAAAPLKTFLDFGYPLGEASYVSIAVLVFLLSRNFLGGRMKRPVEYLIVALVVQYLADAVFLYQSSQGTWYVGGFNDFLYALSYFLMTICLWNVGGVFNKLSSEK